MFIGYLTQSLACSMHQGGVELIGCEGLALHLANCYQIDDSHFRAETELAIAIWLHICLSTEETAQSVVLLAELFHQASMSRTTLAGRVDLLGGFLMHPAGRKSVALSCTWWSPRSRGTEGGVSACPTDKQGSKLPSVWRSQERACCLG